MCHRMENLMKVCNAYIKNRNTNKEVNNIKRNTFLKENKIDYTLLSSVSLF